MRFGVGVWLEVFIHLASHRLSYSHFRGEISHWEAFTCMTCRPRGCSGLFVWIAELGQLLKPLLGALETTGGQEGHQLQLQIAALKARSEAILAVSFALLCPLQQRELDRALVKLKDEQIVAIV